MTKCKEGYKRVGNKCVKKDNSKKTVIERNYKMGGGIGFFGLLALIFITLKLTHVIDWSWWIILLPLWGPFVLSILFALFVFLIFRRIFKKWF